MGSCTWVYGNFWPSTLVCSYDKSLGAMRNFGLSQVREMQEKVASGSPFMLCWDNLVRTEKKEEETRYNRRVLLSMTSGYVQFLHIPPPPLSATNPNSPNHWMVYTYRNIMDAMKSNKNRHIGLPKCLLEVKQPRYDTVTPFDLVFVDSIQKHQPLIAHGHTAKILQRFCGRSLSVTLGLSRNRSVWRIKGNQATFDNSQRNNLRSCVWVWW